MKILQMTPSFDAVKQLIERTPRLHYLLEDDVEVCAVPLHGGYYRDGIFIDRFARDESMYEKAISEGWEFYTRNLVSYLQRGRLVKQFVIIGSGYNVLEVFENGMAENNY